MTAEPDFDVIVIGAGGAGMMCAIHAARRGRSIVLLDHAEKIGRKILISGGGRCNFTNVHAGPGNYVSKNPHFAKSALAQYKPSDFIAMVREHRIPFHEKKLGQLFCDHSAQAIVDMLVNDARTAGAQFRMGVKVHSIAKDAEVFKVSTSNGYLRSSSVVIATGGLSIPKIGATGFGYDTAQHFGLKIIETFPALVGFDWSFQDLSKFAELAGVSVDSQATCGKASFRENVLFTHGGLSGPAILQASLYWNTGSPVNIDLSPEDNLAQWLVSQKKSGSTKELKNVLAEKLPRRLAEKFCELHLPSRNLQEMSEAKMTDFGNMLNSWKVVPAKNNGYAKAEVTRGGVDTAELSSKTMECKKVPGLYFIGEVVDVTGWLGGYNFQWAWASAFAAAQYV